MGKVVVVEGVDYAGKTSAINSLKEYLESKGREVYVFGEPGSSPVGKRIKTILIDPELSMDEKTRLSLLTSARFELLNTVLPPLLEKENTVIILDRYIPSYYAYAEEVHWSFMDKLVALHKTLTPTLTYYLKINEETFLSRINNSVRENKIDGIETKLIKRFNDYTARYDKYLVRWNSPIVTIDANDSILDVQAAMISFGGNL